MRVLHVIWHLGQGGAQTYLYNLINEQIIDPELEPALLILGNRGALSEDFDKLVNVEYLNMRKGMDIFRAMRIPRAVKKSNADLIHSHSNNLAFNIALQFQAVPVVYTEHGGGLLGGRKRDYLVYRYLSGPLCRIIAISREMARVMGRANPKLIDRIKVVYNGVNVDRIVGIGRHDGQGLDERILHAEHRVGIIGRLEEQKGIDVFLKAASKLCAQRDDAVFIIIGDGSLREQLERLASDLQVHDKTIFLGYRTDALSLLKMFDLFLFTSDYEPFGLVIAEAMAAGVPVVAMHERGAVPEILTDKVDGFIVHGKDHDRIVQCVNMLLDDRTLISQIVQRASETVRKRFTIQINAQGVKDVYKECRPLATAF